MDVIASLRGAAYARPHVLTVAAPGATGIRIEVERFARARGWPMADSPADADVLVEAGQLSDGLRDAADLVERQLGEPYVRVALSDAAEVEAGLDDAPSALATARPVGRPPGDWPEPPMAGRAADRDGLALDVLRIPFGPIVPHWPAGLRLALDVQGDIVQACEVERLGVTGASSFWSTAGSSAARSLDRVARLLAIAGRAGTGQRCRVLRDRALAGERDGRFADDVLDTARRIRRSRLLRALLAGVGETTDAGDAWQRLSGWLADATGSEPEVRGQPSSREWLDRLPDLVTGHELTTVRLIVASIDVDLAELPEHSGAAHG